MPDFQKLTINIKWPANATIIDTAFSTFSRTHMARTDMDKTNTIGAAQNLQLNMQMVCKLDRSNISTW